MDFLIDIGNVLLCFDFEPALATLLPKNITDPEERIAKLITKKDEFESGKITEDDYISWASIQLGYTGNKENFIKAWTSIFTRNDPMWDLCKKMKADGHRLILFSNTNSLHANYFEKEHSPFETFDEAIYSFHVNSIKPNPPIYQHALDTYNLQPSNTVYIDDLEENIQTGRAFGFQSWQYNHEKHGDLEIWLKGILN